MRLTSGGTVIVEFAIRPLVDDAENCKELEWEVGNRRGDGVQRRRKMRSGAPTRLCRVEKPEAQVTGGRENFGVSR